MATQKLVEEQKTDVNQDISTPTTTIEQQETTVTTPEVGDVVSPTQAPQETQITQPVQPEQVIAAPEPVITPEPTVVTPTEEVIVAEPVVVPTPAPVIPRVDQFDSIAKIEEAGLTLTGTETVEQIQAKALEAENVIKRRDIVAEEQKAAAIHTITSENDAFVNIVRTWNADTTFDGVQIDEELKTNANIRYNIASTYLNASTSQLYSAMKTGKLAMLDAKQQFQTYSDTQNINEDATLNAQVFSDGEVDIITPKKKPTTEKVSDMLIAEKGLDYAEVFRDTVIEDTEITSLVEDINAKEAQKAKIELAKKKILDDVKKTYSGATISMQMAIAARQSKDLNDELSTLNIDIAQDQANLNYQTGIATQLFDLEIQRKQEIFSLIREESELTIAEEEQRTARIATTRENVLGLVANISNSLVNPLSDPQKWTARARNLADSGMTRENIEGVLLQEMQSARGGDLKFQNEEGEEIPTEQVTLWDRKILINSETGEEIASYDIGIDPAKGDTVAETFNVNEWFTPISMRDFLKGSEGFRTNAYLDPAGIPTIGYGFTTINGKPVKMGDIISLSDAEQELTKQISKHQSYKNLVTTPLSEAQNAALTSFEYNLGSGIWNPTTKDNASEVITLINKWDLQGAADYIQLFNKARDPETNELRALKWLSTRRQKEAQMLMDIPKFNPALKPLYIKWNTTGNLTNSDKDFIEWLGISENRFVDEAQNFWESSLASGAQSAQM